MSCSFRSKKTFEPEATISRTTCGPAALKSWSPTLKNETSPDNFSTSASASDSVGTSSATMIFSAVLIIPGEVEEPLDKFILSSSGLADKLQAMQVHAPAKINLSLEIRERRPDGF